MKISLELKFGGLNNSHYSTGGHAIVPWVTFHQSNRVIKEKYRRELFDHVTKQVPPEKFYAIKTTDPQEFYLSFKNCVVPIINTEIQVLRKTSLIQVIVISYY